ncbi:MAG TPA: DUF2249 domain-containing protein [Gemmatimonadaceae bacterium]|nr:DUF2249 domain-containing protein [Gemmatimonadaceae bacterium]
MTRAGSGNTPVVGSDRVSDVLKRDERLVDVFVGVSPQFAKLRNAGIRKVMARLTTVAQAARIAGVPLATLLDALNAALDASDAREASSASPVNVAAPVDAGAADPVSDTASPDPAPPAPAPAWLTGPVVELDVRPLLAAGQEPFPVIMEAVGALGADQVLLLRAPFEPVPLFAVLARRGFEHYAQQQAADDWCVWFCHANAAPPAAIVLDVRDMEPPEPMVRTLEAAERLGPHEMLLQVNVRVPEFLLPVLERRGFSYAVKVIGPDEVHVHIVRRPS